MSTVLYVKVLEEDMHKNEQTKNMDEGRRQKKKSYIGDLMGTKQSVDACEAPFATMPIHHNQQLDRTAAT